MSNRLVVLMLGTIAGAGAIVWLLLRQEPGAARATMPQPTVAAPAPVGAQPVEPAPVTTKPIATVAPSGHPDQPVPNAPGPAPLPPGVTLREGHSNGQPVEHINLKKMPLEQKLEKAAQLAKVLETQAALLDKEAADADAAGKSEEAAHKRVQVKRLRARADELHANVESRTEPQ